jgi:hypothetical protein
MHDFHRVWRQTIKMDMPGEQPIELKDGSLTGAGSVCCVSTAIEYGRTARSAVNAATN